MSFLSRRATPAHTSWYADQSANSLPVNRFGGVVQNDEGSGIRSASFNGSTGYLTTTTQNFQSGNSTIEFWMKPTQYVQQAILHCTNSLHIHMMTGGTLHVNNAITPDVAMPVLLNVWQHVAVVIDGSSKRVFLNGVLKYTTSQLWNNNNNPLFIGRNTAFDQFYYNGLLAGLRIIKGTALYTTDFTPPVLLPTAVPGTTLLMNFGATTAPTWYGDTSTSFALVSSVATTLIDEGYGIKAANFNGTSAYLTTPNSTNYDLNGDFTVEAFVKVNTRQSQDTFIINGRGAVANSVYCGWALRQDTGNGLSFYRYIGGTDITFGFNYAIPGNSRWYHIAASRTGSTLRTFVNGALTNTHTTSLSFARFNTTDALLLGRGTYQSTQTFYLNGAIAGARVVSGTGIYTTNFNVPTTIPTAVSGTRLLMNFGATAEPIMWLNTSTTQSTYLSSAAQTGTVTQITRGNVTSAYTNKEGYLTASLDNNIGTGDFDISFFVKFNESDAANSEHIIYQTSGGIAILRAADETIKVNKVNTGDRLISSIAVRDTNWHYIQVTRNTGTMTMYIDGINVGSVANSDDYPVKDMSMLWNAPTYLFGAEITGVRFSRSGSLSTAVPTTVVQPDATTTLLMNFGSTDVPNLWYGDNSSNSYAVSLSGSPSLVDEGNGVKAIAFNGTTDWVYTTVPGNFPGDFTIEFFAKNNTTADCWYIGNTVPSAANSNGWSIGVLVGNLIRLSSYTFGYNTAAFGGSNTYWNHIAVTRSGSTIRIFVNGILLDSRTSASFTFSNTDPIRLGNISNLFYPAGRLTNVRIVKGTALYTANFVVPTTVLSEVADTALLMPFTSTAVPLLWYRDTSSSPKPVELFGTPIQYDFGNRVDSAMFDGNSSRLVAYSTNGFTFGTGNWTVEFFVQLLVIPTTADADCFVSTADPTDFNGIYIGVGNTRQLVILASSNGASWTFTGNTTTAIELGKWHHIAVVVNAGTLTTYIDGISDSSAAISLNIPCANGKMLIGGRTKSSQYSTSRIAGLRVVKGTAVYTSNFNVPTTLPTSIAGTELLMNFDSEVWAGLTNTSDRYFKDETLLLKFNGTNGATTFTDLSPRAYTITNTGAGAISTARSKYGSGSYLGAVNSYFTVGTDNTPFAFGTGDFTIEFWYYAASTAAQHNIIVFSNLTNSAIVQLGSTFRYQYLNVNRITSTSIVINTWYHVAVSRVSGTSRMFLNGVLQTTTYADTINYLSTGTQWQFGGNAAYVNGNMDDLCITKGVGKYITSFIPQENYNY